jgi:AAA family ATP:ADP antiporter
VGSWLADTLVSTVGLRSEHLLLAALVPLALSIALTRACDSQGGTGPTGSPEPQPEAPGGGGALATVLGSRFLLAVALITMILNWVNTNGENVLFRVVQEMLEEKAQLQGIASDAAILDFVRDGTTAFYGNFFFWVNVLALFLQAIVASRLLKFGGFGSIFLLLPVIALASYSVIALVPILFVVKLMKIAENATDYSINNTARHVLWLPMSSQVTFKAKPTIDTLFARVGDGLAALTVMLGVHAMTLSVSSFAAVNVVLIGAWLLLAVWIVREYLKLTPPAEDERARA